MNEQGRHSVISPADDVQARSKVYDGFLRQFIMNYRSYSRSQKIMRWIFYVVIILLLAGMVGACCFAAFRIWERPELELADLVIMLGLMLGAVAAFVTLPRIIAECVLAKPEQDEAAQIVCALIEHDKSVRVAQSERPNSVQKTGE